MPFLPSRTRLLIALGAFGVLMLATGLAWDLVAHARDSGLAADEGVLSLDNPSHVLVGVGILAATIGLLGTAWDVLKATAPDTTKTRIVPVAVLASIALAVGVGAFLAVTTPHDHSVRDNRVGVDESISTAAALDVDRSRLPADEAIALATLAWSRPGTVDEHGHHTHADPYAGPFPQSPLSVEEARELASQLEAAVASAELVMETSDAAANGYVQSALQVPGVGSHWTKWSLVDQEFDPARPSQLLFHQETQGGPAKLAAFSYWVRSVDEPEGFAGSNDDWHQHIGLCFINGWLHDTNVLNRADCAGDWVNGSDLWMLHAWIVSGVENEWGVFSQVNPALCPDPVGIPDVLTCSRGLV